MGGGDGVKTPADAPERGLEAVGTTGDGGGDAGPGWAADVWGAWGLFLLTLFSTLVAGSLLNGADPLGLEFGFRAGVPFWWPTRFDSPALLDGGSFAFPLVGILLAHEWAHRTAARSHGIPVSPPFFLPCPPHLSVVGTLGAFIRLRGAVPSRAALLDVGLSGPLVSLLLSLAALGWGLSLSVPSGLIAQGGLPFLILFQDIPIRLGEPLLVRGMLELLGTGAGEGALLLHPLAFAGWLGLVLTFLNLLPLDRLDGGHILHALDPSRQRWWRIATVGVFLGLGFLWPGWWIWAGVMLVLGRIRPLPHDAVGTGPLPSAPRRWVAWCVMASVPFLLPPIPVGL